MESLIIQSTTDTPEVIFNPVSNIFIISGKSLPENSSEFYKPIIEWLTAYTDAPGKENTFKFDLEYLNTGSSKQLSKIFLILEYISKTARTKIVWQYAQGDENMRLAGERFNKSVKCDFELQEKN